MRRTEVFSGLMLLLVSFSYIASLLLDFKFVSPYATPVEDLTYLAESINSQRISSIAWGVSASLSVLIIPFYLKIFHRRQKGFQYLNGMFMLGSAACFLLMAYNGYVLYREMAALLPGGLDHVGEETSITMLQYFDREQEFRLLGSTGVGIWAMGLGLSRFRVRRIPLTSSVLLVTFGPVLIFFNWFDPEHLARTAALAAILIGVMAFGVRLINRGLGEIPVPETEA